MKKIVILSLWIVISCDHLVKESDDNNSGVSIKEVFQNGYFQYSINHYTNFVSGRYSLYKLTGNEMSIRSWEWNDSLKLWSELSETEIHGNYLSEYHHAYYHDGEWGNVTTGSTVGLYSEPVVITNDYIWNVNKPLFPYTISVDSEEKLDGKLIVDYDPELSNVLVPNTLFKKNSSRYHLKFVPDYKNRVYTLSTRSCELDSAIINVNNQYECSGKEWISNKFSNYKSLEELRSIRNNENNTIPRNPYSYYFKDGTNSVIVIKNRDHNNNIIDSVLNEEGEWEEKVVNGVKIMDITLPFLSDFPVDVPTEFEKGLQPTFLERDSTIYESNRLNKEIIDYTFPLYNDSSMYSILEGLDF